MQQVTFFLKPTKLKVLLKWTMPYIFNIFHISFCQKAQYKIPSLECYTFILLTAFRAIILHLTLIQLLAQSWAVDTDPVNHMFMIYWQSILILMSMNKDDKALLNIHLVKQ
jgi:hypothetical protein